jgi:hypothetical protein
MGTGPKPAEALKVICIRKGEQSVHFVGHETAPDSSKVSLLLVGDPEYFIVGRAYAVVFQPLPPDVR